MPLFQLKTVQREAGATESRMRLTTQEARNRSPAFGLSQGNLLKLSMSSVYLEYSSIMSCHMKKIMNFYCN